MLRLWEKGTPNSLSVELQTAAAASMEISAKNAKTNLI